MRRQIASEPTGVVLRRGSGLPVYLQVVDQLRYLIAAGRFRVGEYLPPMRQVADELGLNLNTVLRAYAELQRDGIIRSTRGKGAVILRTESESATAYRSATGEVPESIDAMISAAVEHALSAGLDPAEVIARTQAALESAGGRAPAGPTIGVLASPAWRARELAESLRAMGAGRVRPVSEPAGIEGCDLVVRPLFGVLDPAAPPVGAPTLDVALLLDRACIREILEIEPRSSVIVVAGDERAATWLADAVSGYAGIVNVARVVAPSLGEAGLSGPAVVVVERGMSRGALAASGSRVIQAGAVFPASISESIALRLVELGQPVAM